MGKVGGFTGRSPLSLSTVDFMTSVVMFSRYFINVLFFITPTLNYSVSSGRMPLEY